MIRKSSSRTPKDGVNSQERLLEAAVDVFGREGFDAATTRMIAREAGVNIAAIPYYFAGKEGLYQATISHIADMLETELIPALKEVKETFDQGRPSPGEALRLLENVMDKLINFMVGSQQGPRFARLIIREHLYPSSAYAVFFGRVMGPMMSAISSLIEITYGEPSPRTAKLRAAAVVGQVMAFRVARETLVRALGMEGYSPSEVAEIREVILDQTRKAVGGDFYNQKGGASSL